MERYEKTVRSVLRYMGITGNYKGFASLSTAISMVIEQEELLCDVTSKLYPMVAQKHKTTSDRLQRNFRTIVETCWKEKNRGRLFQIAGRTLTERPTTMEFIDLLAAYVSKHPEDL